LRVDELGDIVQEFLVESYENLDQLDRDLVALEQQPGAKDLLSSVFRTIHTIKGTSGFLAFNRLERVTHVGESLLSRLRDGAQSMTPETTTALLQMVDVVRTLLATIEQTGVEGDTDIEGVITTVNAEIERGSNPPAKPKARGKSAGSTAANKGKEAEGPTGSGPADEPADVAAPESEPEPEPEQSPTGQSAPVSETAPTPAASPPEKAKVDNTPDDEQGIQARRTVADSSIRVDVDLLDTLMRLVGELVLTRNQMTRGIQSITDPALTRTAQRLNLITSELQESVMKTRMQAIDHLWSKLPRVVRDLSGSVGKQIRLVMEGKETELDRSLLEAVKDPLTHLVRNAVDHGVEAADVRVASGKPAEGTLRLRAYHEGGHVIVEVADDGKGMDPDRIAQVAVDRGVVTREQVAHMERHEILNLVFRPGFSTADKVTNVSGRGVGMDVVKTNIERIGGAVDVDSTVGEGTTWRLAIPLTLAIIQALTIECGGERYVIPQVNVHELVYLDGQNGRVIEHAMGAQVYRLRGKLLPLVRLDETLGLPGGDTDRDVYVAVLQADSRQFGLVVDRVLNTEEVVVKALSSRFKEIGVYSGATLLGDGAVALILDVPALARRAKLNVGTSERLQAEFDAAKRAGSRQGDRLLVVGVGERRVAIPLDMVTRLEEFPLSKIEHVGSREVVQYRNQILPVLRLGQMLGVYSDTGSEETLQVAVYTEGGRSVALAVDRIVDIVEDAVCATRDFGDAGLTGSAVIQQRITELLDVRLAIMAADPNFDMQHSDICEDDLVDNVTSVGA
jgi:two-component system chemotaxis sensor kinase CheA